MIFNRRLKTPKGSAFLFGPRMTGKSTWLKLHFKDYLWIDLLKNTNYQLYLANPERLTLELEHLKNIKGVVIDEIQRVPSLLNEVHHLIENTKLNFLLSGSSARKLKRGSANLLAGRAIELKLFPLTLLEAPDEKLENILMFGMLPKIVSTSKTEKIDILQSYVNTYLREEVQAEGLVRNLPSFSKFLNLAAESASQEVNYSNISRETTVKSKTIKEYFSILEDTLIGHLLLPWERSIRKQLAGSPKFYFFDNGVTHSLRETLGDKISPETIGVFFEQWIINEIKAELNYQRFSGSLFFWRVRGGGEVDLIISKGPKPIAAIEIKNTTRPSKKDFSGLHSFHEEYPNVPLFLVTNVVRDYQEDGIQIKNYKTFLFELGNHGYEKAFC